MRTTLLLLFAAFLVACGSGDSVERIVKVYPNGNPERMVIYDASETNIIGEKFFYDDGGVRVEGLLQDGERHGTWHAYTMEGNLLSVNNYNVGEYDGPYENYFPDGGLRIQGAYSNGKEIGEWIVFNNEGQRHGLYRRFDTEGNLREKGVYDKGQKSGIWEEFNANGSRIGYSNH